MNDPELDRLFEVMRAAMRALAEAAARAIRAACDVLRHAFGLPDAREAIEEFGLAAREASARRDAQVAGGLALQRRELRRRRPVAPRQPPPPPVWTSSLRAYAGR